ncbi:MAG: hypothetical protein ACFCD0_23905 [Gemmataceae bacterium]
MADQQSIDNPNGIHINGKHDKITHRMVVGCVGAIAIICALTYLILPMFDLPVPEGTTAIGGMSLLALTNMMREFMGAKDHAKERK